MLFHDTSAHKRKKKLYIYIYVSIKNFRSRAIGLNASRELTVFLDLRSRKTVRFSEQMMSVDKYPNICVYGQNMKVYTSNEIVVING